MHTGRGPPSSLSLISLTTATFNRPHSPPPPFTPRPGELRCTYRAYDSVDEVSPAYSLAFSLDGGRLYAGVNRAIHAWDVARPGRDHATLTTYRKHQEGQPGGWGGCESTGAGAAGVT